MIEPFGAGSETYGGEALLDLSQGSIDPVII